MNTELNLTHKSCISRKGIKLTNAAIQHITCLMDQEPNVLGLKITIKKSGCAGFTYKIDKVFFIEENMIIYKFNKIKLFIPVNIISIINGTELDYVQEGLNFSFKFYNPNAQFICGCGLSFST